MSNRVGRRNELGYDVRSKLDGAPSAEEIEIFGKWGLRLRSVSEPAGRDEELVARIGDLAITRFLLPDGAPIPPDAVPVLAARRGDQVHPIGIDTAVWTRERFRAGGPHGDGGAGMDGAARALLTGEEPIPISEVIAASALRQLLSSPPTPRLSDVLPHLGVDAARDHVRGSPCPVVVAVIDQSFQDVSPDDDESVGPVEPTPPLVPATGAGGDESEETHHGAKMVGAVATVLEGTSFSIRRILLPPASKYLESTFLALAIAHAVAPATGALPADVVLVARGHVSNGMPPVLDAVLSAAARAGRGGRGAVIVCSSGHFDANHDNLFDLPSVAHGADELGSHPDTLLVGPCDLDGRWFRTSPAFPLGSKPKRRGYWMVGRLAPSVAVSAPGMKVLVDHRRETLETDNSSLSAAIVAGVAALMLLANPSLTPLEVRSIVHRTSLVPRAVDDTHGAESLGHSAFDRAGHNFKVGAGMINALGAVLSAADPIAQTALQVVQATRPTQDPNGLSATPEHAVGRWLDYWITNLASSSLAEGYRKHRGLLARLLVHSLRGQEELSWILRHLMAVFTYDGDHTWFRWSTDPGVEDHGALVRRLHRLVRTAHEELRAHQGVLGRHDGGVHEWLGELGEALPHAKSVTVEGQIRLALLGTGVPTERAVRAARLVGQIRSDPDLRATLRSLWLEEKEPAGMPDEIVELWDEFQELLPGDSFPTLPEGLIPPYIVLGLTDLPDAAEPDDNPA